MKETGRNHTPEVTAIWNSDTSLYCVADREWYAAEDGNEWTDGAGVLVDSPEFHRATIRLFGGPRDGDVVG